MALLPRHVGCTSHGLLQFAVTDAQSISHVHQSAFYKPAKENNGQLGQPTQRRGLLLESLLFG